MSIVDHSLIASSFFRKPIMKTIFNVQEAEINAPVFFTGFPDWDERTIQAFQFKFNDHIPEHMKNYAIVQLDGRGYPLPLLFSNQAFKDLPEREVTLKRQEVLYSYDKEYRAEQNFLQDLEDRFFVENKKKYHF